MKLGQRRLVTRRSSPYQTNPVRERIMSQYEQLGYDKYPVLETDEQQYKPVLVELEELEKGENIIEKLNELGWLTDFSFHPEKYKDAGTPINELQQLSTFLPDNLARQSAAKHKASKLAENALPANATDAQIKDLADKIYQSDLQEAIGSSITKTKLPSSNVLQQVKQDAEDMEAYRIMTNPYARAMALGIFDPNTGEEIFQGKLSYLSEQVENELKLRAGNFGKGYFDSMFQMLRDVSANDNTEKAVNNILYGNDILNNDETYDPFAAKAFANALSGDNTALPSSDYLRDAQNAFLQGRKEVRIQNYQGQIARGTEFKTMADNVLRAYLIKGELDEVNNILDQYQQAYTEGGLNERQKEAHADMLARKHELEQELEETSKYIDILGSYESVDFAKDGRVTDFDKNGRMFQPTIFGIPIDQSRPRDFAQAIQGKLNKFGLSTDIGVHHYLAGYDKLTNAIKQLELEDYRHDPKKMEKMNYLRNQLSKLLNNYKGLIDERIEDWSKSAKEETSELDEMKQHYTLSDAFQANVELAQRNMDFADANTMMFAMPQQLGSSNASMLLSMGSMAVKILAAANGSPLAITGGVIGGSQLGIANAAWENNAEVAEGYKRKITRDFKRAGIYDDVIAEIKHRLPETNKMKDDDVLNRLFNGEVELNNIQANKILTDDVFGADLAFQYDMGETARGSYRESMLQLMPLGPVANAGKYVLSPLGRAAGWTLNKTAEGIGAGLYKGINAGRKLFKKDPLVVEKTLSGFDKVLDGTIHFATSVPRSILLGETYASNILGFTGRTWLNAIGEGVEEGVQHVTQLRFYNGEYDSSMNMGLFKPIVEDMVLGGRLGLEWITGSDYGSGYISDAQMFAEMRGGALGALFQATPINVVHAISKASSEISAAEFVANNIIRDKMSQRDKIEKIKSFLAQTSSARYDDVMKKFDRFIKINNLRTETAKRLDNEEYGIPEEFIEDARDLYKRAHTLTTNEALNRAYKEAKIYKGTPEYNERIAILVDQIDRLKESSDQFDESEKVILQRVVEALNMNQAAEAANLLAEQDGYESQQEPKYIKLESVARLKAALDIIHQYEEAERQREAEGKPARKSAIKKNAETVKKLINKQLGTNINTTEELFEKFGAVDDEAVEAYRDNIVLQTERDVARATVSRLFSPQTAAKTVDKLAKQYHEAIKEDEELQQRILDDYVSKIEFQEEIRQMQQEVQRLQTVDSSGEELLEEESNDANEITTQYELEDLNPPGSVITREQADDLINGFIDRFSNEYGPHEVRGRIKDRAKPLVKYNLTKGVDKLKRSAAQRLTSLFNDGYRARTEGDNYYFVKGQDRIKVNRTEALFGQYLEERFGNNTVERDESFRPTVQDQSLPESQAAPIAQEVLDPEDEEYKPNAVLQLIRDALKEKARKDKETLVKRNGHNYFFKVLDKIAMYTRLHAVIGSQVPDSVEDEERKLKTTDELSAIWSDKNAVKDYINKLQQDYNKALENKYGVSSETYAHNKIDLGIYLQDGIINNQNIIEAIADITKGLRYDADGKVVDVFVVDGPWAKAGNIFDTMFRLVLDGNAPKYTDVITIEDVPVIISDVMSANVFDDTMRQMFKFKDWLSENKIVPITDRVLLHSQLKNGQYVAGETDLIGVDEHGNLIIFDFKTSKWEFDQSYKQTRDGYKWSTERQHSRQLTGYNALIEQEFAGRYPVTRLIIVPAVVQYGEQSGVFTRFHSIGIRPVIELLIDNALNKALNENVDKNKMIQDAVADLTVFDESVTEYASSISDQFPHLSLSTQSSLRNIRTRTALIRQRLEQLNQDSTQLEIENAIEDAYNLLQDFEKLVEDVNNEIQMLIEAGVQFGKQLLQQEEYEHMAHQEEEHMIHPDEDFPNPAAEDEAYWEHLEKVARGEEEPPRRKDSLSHVIDRLEEAGRLLGPDRGRISGTLPDDNPSTAATTSGAFGAAPVETVTKSILDAPDYSSQEPVEFEATAKETGIGHTSYNVADQRDITGLLAGDAAEDDFTKLAVFKIQMKNVEAGLNGQYLYTTIKWKGKSYTVKFEWGTSPTGIAKALRVKEKIRALMAANPGAQLVISKLSRTNGKFIFEGDQKNLLDSPFMTNDEELLDILDSGTIGVTNTAIVPQVNAISRKSNGAIHVYSVGADITPGIVTWVMRPNRAEYEPGQTPTIAIPLTHRRLQSDDIDLIVDILKSARGKDLTRQFRTITVNGRQVKSPMSDWAILNTLIRFGRASRETNKGNNFVFDFLRNGDLVDKSIIEISGIGEDRRTIYHVDLTKPEDVEKLKLRLRVSGFVYANNEQLMLAYNLDSSIDTGVHNPFGKVSQFFRAEENKDVDSIKISSSLIFDRKDVDFKEDGSFIALSGAGWMIRHGWVTTNFKKLTNPRVSMEDVDIDDIDKSVINERANDPENNTREAVTEPADVQVGAVSFDQAENDATNAELLAQTLGDQIIMPFRIQTEPAETPIDIEKAVKRIHRMLGQHFKVNVVNGAVKVFEQGKAWAVGVCKQDSITLSRLAEAGTEFHEAFHRVMELLFSPSARRKLHEHYIKRYNNGEPMTEQQTGEHLAEMFMRFINGLPNVYLSWNIRKMLGQVLDWVNAWRNLDDYTLALTFAYAYSGLARFNRVSKASSENFNRIFKGAAYSTIDVSGTPINFKHFVNGVHLRDGIKYATYLILTGYKIDSLGSNLKDLDIRMTTMREKPWFKIVTGEGKENPTLLNLQMREIFDHWGTTQKLVAELLERLGIGSKIDRNNKKDEDKQGPDVSVIYQDIDGHIDEFYRFDKKDDLDISLKIFLSTIPNMRYSTRADLMWETNEAGQFIDKDGNVTTDKSKRVRRTITRDGKVIPIGTVDSLTQDIPGTNDGTGHPRKRRTYVPVSTNSIGSLEFMDFDTVYTQLINKLQDCVDVEDMIQTLIKLSAESPMYREIAYKVYEWNARAVARHKSSNPTILGKPMAYIGDMRLDPNDYEYVKDKNGVYHVVYAKDAEGNHAGDVIKNAYILTNPDMESLVTTMFQSFKSQRLKFIFVFANQKRDSLGNKTGKMTYINKPTNSTASVRIYPKQWFDNLRNGIGDIFELTSSSIKVKKGAERVYAQVAQEMRMIYQQMIDTSKGGIVKIKYNGKDMILNKYLPEDLDLIESLFVSNLNKIGIDIDKSMLDFYLNDRYFDKDNKTERFIEMFSSRSRQSSFQSFIKMLDQMQSIINDKNWQQILTDINPTKWNKGARSGMYIYSENAFIKELAEAYGRYRLATNEFMTLGPENTKMYTMSLNHSESEFTDELNRAVINNDGTVTGSEMLQDMMKFCYNYMRLPSGRNIGSIIIKHLLNPNRMPLDTGTFIGVRRDDIHDGGTKYTKISKRDDYLAKCTILENGGITFPTLSDKSTWFYLTGVRLPGIDYTGAGSNTVAHGALPKFNFINGRVFWGSDTVGNYGSNEVLDQMLEYAECERAAVVKAINELKTLKENEASEKNPNRKLEIHKLIENYHTKNQAAKFAFLLGVYTEDAKDENYKYKSDNEKFISFNYTKKWNSKTKQYEDASLEDCLKTADKYFFNKTEAERRSMIANMLQHRLDELLLWAVDAGIIERNPNSRYGGYTQYKNKLLNDDKIKALTEAYMSVVAGNNKTYDKIYTIDELESMAVVAYLNDINAKSIMSIEEVMRLYTGIPQFFKWKYGSDGVLADLHSDLVKRLGGLGSTGDSNRLDLPNIERDYVCAEIEDQNIKSDMYDAFKEGFLDNEYRITVFQQEVDNAYGKLSKMSEQQQEDYRKKLWADIMTKDLEEVKKMASPRTQRIVEANAAAETASFEKKINVADGTAYISPLMCLNLLRERGVFTKEVQDAFAYLMDLSTGSDLLSNHKAYNIIFNALISTQKYSAFGYRMEGDVPVHFYNKFALFPLFKSIAYGFTKDLYEKMQEDGVDMLMFESAVKVGSEGKQEFNPDTFRRSDDENDENNWKHDKDGNRIEMKPDIRNFHFNTYKLQYKFIRRQLNTDPNEEERMHIGTQMLKITLANLFKEAMYKTSRGEISGKELRDDIMECMKKLSDDGLRQLKEDLFTNDKIDIKKLSKFLKHELTIRNADANTLEGLDVIGEGDDARFVTPLEAMSNIEWIESILISHINKQVIDINLPGNAFYQRSAFGIEGSPIRVVSDDVYNNTKDTEGFSGMLNKAKKLFMIYSGRSLKVINNEGSMDCIISIDYFMNQKGLIPKEYRNNYWAAREYLKKKGIIGKNAKAIMIGYRIPTQAESSVHALRVVDVLPVVRDTIILPKEFTKITGSDFDIDKMYLTSYNFNEDGTTNFEESDTKYWQNRLLENYMTLLKDGGYVDDDGKYHKGRTLQFLHRSIDNDTSLARGDENSVYERIVGNLSKGPAQPFQFQSLSTQVDIKTQFLGGKFNIGPFALANNALIMTMLYDVEFRDIDGSIMSVLGANSLHNRTDKNGNSILAWISAMINGAVDAAKDPWEAELNVNPYTYGIINMLLRTGMGDQTFMFVNQPIMREAADAFILADGVLVDDTGKTKTRRQLDAVKSRIHSHLDSLGEGYKKFIEVMTDPWADQADKLELHSKTIEIVKLLFGVDNTGKQYTNEFYTWDIAGNDKSKDTVKGRSILEDIIVNPEVRKDPDKPMSMDNMSTVPYYAILINGEYEPFSAKEVQLYVMAALYEFKPFIDALEDTVKYTKIDTKKQGNTYATQKQYHERYLALLESEDSLFNDNLKRMLRDSFIGDKTEKTWDFLDESLNNMAIQYKQGFLNFVDRAKQDINNYSDEVDIKIQRIALGYIKHYFFKKYMKQNGIDQEKLFVGKDSIANRYSRIRKMLLTDLTGEYGDYVANGVIINSLLDALQTAPYDKTAKQPSFVMLKRSMIDDPDMANDIIKAWRYMLTDNMHPELLKFANDLVVYAFLTSNDTPGFTHFFKFVPKEWKEQSGFNKIMTDFKNAEDDLIEYSLYNKLDEMLEMNWFDNSLVPTQTFSESDSTNGSLFYGYHINTVNPVIKKSGIYSIMGALWQHRRSRRWRVSIKDKTAPKYIKIYRRNADSYEDDRILLYKLIDHGTKIVGKEMITYPIYALITPPGANVNASGNRFNIYSDVEFEHQIDEIAISPDREDQYRERVDGLIDWLEGTPGAVLSENEDMIVLGRTADKGYTTILEDVVNNYFSDEQWFLKAVKEGSKIKDFCNKV